MHDRLVKKIKTTRPPDIYPEFWTAMSPKHRREATAEWHRKLEALEAARLRRRSNEGGGSGGDSCEGVPQGSRVAGGSAAADAAGAADAAAAVDVVAADAAFDHDNSHDDVRDELPILGMPTIPTTRHGHDSKSDHDDGNLYAMISERIPIQQASKIPAAKAAMQAEWDKLKKLRTWDEGSVKEHDVVVP